jgi:hypothetical protein
MGSLVKQEEHTATPHPTHWDPRLYYRIVTRERVFRSSSYDESKWGCRKLWSKIEERMGYPVKRRQKKRGIGYVTEKDKSGCPATIRRGRRRSNQSQELKKRRNLAVIATPLHPGKGVPPPSNLFIINTRINQRFNNMLGFEKFLPH